MDFLLTCLRSMPGAVGQGLIWGIMAIGVYLTYKILDVADLTVDGSLATGGAVCVMLTVNGANPATALLCAVLAGMLAGLVTGLFHTACGIPAILSGILTQLALYSINLRIMGWVSWERTTARRPRWPSAWTKTTCWSPPGISGRWGCKIPCCRSASLWW